MTQPADKPPEKPTVELEPPPKWAIQLTEKVVTLNGRVEQVIENHVDVITRIQRIEEDVGELKSWRSRTSVGVKQLSSSDESQNSAIAAAVVEAQGAKAAAEQAKAETQALAAKFEEGTTAQTAQILDKIEKAAQTPLGKRVATLLYILVGLAIAAASGYAARSAQQPNHTTEAPK